ncbi:MAG TPA: DUF3866 family protein [Syntrophomonadaceae bacterium]|nr:DUF3866 family protein [Syntrophomonadaceae bacterium]
MIDIKRGYITKELFSRPGIAGYLVKIGGKEEKCICYPDLTGAVDLGDEVILNTTAMKLSLGSGGYHYIIANLSIMSQELEPPGHIMKSRYTPMQHKVLSVEEEDSPYHKSLVNADSIDGIPVLVGTLHSMLAPLCLQLGESKFKVAYIMTDGAALPIAFSNTVHWLKENDLLHGTVTIGDAFGGELEAVNVYSGLLAAKKVLEPDVIIVTMGPGIVGTGTKWGFTGIEQGDILNAVDTLNGIPVCVPRISFADLRDRHKGLSHHTLTVLSRVCRSKAIVPLANMSELKLTHILEQIRLSKLFDRYDFTIEDANDTLHLMKDSGLKMTTMGRTIDEDAEFFLNLGATGIVASKLIKGRKLNKLSLV